MPTRDVYNKPLPPLSNYKAEEPKNPLARRIYRRAGGLWTMSRFDWGAGGALRAGGAELRRIRGGGVVRVEDRRSMREPGQGRRSESPAPPWRMGLRKNRPGSGKGRESEVNYDGRDRVHPAASAGQGSVEQKQHDLMGIRAQGNTTNYTWLQ